MHVSTSHARSDQVPSLQWPRAWLIASAVLPRRLDSVSRMLPFGDQQTDRINCQRPTHARYLYIMYTCIEAVESNTIAQRCGRVLAVTGF